jgi:mannose-6-phosphate isomerase-like protein (cupin superfamily)
MPAHVISRKSAECYKWGGPQGQDCDGWHLLKTPECSIIEELMPPGTSEVRHSHARARQFFFVLEGELTVEVEHHHFMVQAGEGIEISPGQRHQVLNRSANPARMIVTSQPPSHGDRIADGLDLCGLVDDRLLDHGTHQKGSL